MARVSAPKTSILKWNSSDFMQFVSSVGILGNNYNKIKQVMEDNSLEVKDIKGTAEELASLFSIHKIIAKKLRKSLYALHIQQGLNDTVNTTQHKSNNANLNDTSNDNEKFRVNFRGKQGKYGTLKKTFSRNDKISSVALAYRDEECVNQSSKVEKIILQSGGLVLQHDKKLRDYQIVSENNLITVIHKTNNANLNDTSNDNEKFCVNFRGKQGKRVTLRQLFTADSLVSEVAQTYKDEEMVQQHYKLERIGLQSGGYMLKHDKKLGDYNITNENNLITVLFKTVS